MSKQKKVNSKQAFRRLFIDLIYDNMAMENEAVFSKKEIEARSKIQVNNLIKEGIYKKINIPQKYYV